MFSREINWSEGFPNMVLSTEYSEAVNARYTFQSLRVSVETQSDPTAVQNLGQHSSNRIPHDMFTDGDFGPLCPAHSFTVIPLLLSEST